MNKKLISRILGALSSAMIIIAVFVPFISTKSFSINLWDTFEMADALYLPIMIIVFGAIGVIFFSLNFKTEFAYMSTGAIIFFVIMRTIDIIDQNTFNTLGIGYYLLAIGAILTGIMTFINNLKSKKKDDLVVETVENRETSMLDQIDKLYNEQATLQSEISPIQPVGNMVEPIPEQSIQPLNSEVLNPVIDVKNDQQNMQQQVVGPQLVKSTIENNVEQPLVSSEQDSNLNTNPVLQEFTTPNPVNTMQSSVPVGPSGIPSNPVLQEFATPDPVNTMQSSVPVGPSEVPSNPVLQEFQQPTVLTPTFNISEQAKPTTEVQQSVVEQPSSITPLSDINNPAVQQFSNQGSKVSNTNNSDSLDIFGQPLN